MFGFFDPPQLKAHKKAAQAARAMRELVGRELSIEVKMLARSLHWATGQRDAAYAAGQGDIAGNLTLAISDGQDIIDRLGHSTDAILEEVADKWTSADNAVQFEAVTSYEVGLRNVLVRIRDEARKQITLIGEATIGSDRLHSQS